MEILFINELRGKSNVMTLSVSPSKTIRELQNEFHAVYPFLKLEMFKKSHRAGKPSPKSEMVEATASLSTMMGEHAAGDIDISGTRTVTALESDFRKSFGLNVQVFRKSQSLWIETSLTDHWTLARQNEEGEVFSKPHQPDNLDLGDRDKWE